MEEGQSRVVIFDGRKYAERLTSGLSDRVYSLKQILGRKLKLATIYNPDDRAGRIYTDIKEKKARELGVEFAKFTINNLQFSINDLIRQINNDQSVDGMMIQMPLGTENDESLINLIDLKKDVDGLREESGVVPATVRAVMEILNSKSEDPNKLQIKNHKPKVLIVGNRGLMGKAVQRFMIKDIRFKNLKISGIDKNDFDPEKIKAADVVIGATGVPGLIKPEMVKPGVVCIDVGYPEGDFDPGVAEKASFFTPVPGGVGPVTVVMLFANLADLAEKSL